MSKSLTFLELEAMLRKYKEIGNEEVTLKIDAVLDLIDLLKQKIIMSIKAYELKLKVDAENAFWQSIFENKIVNGKVIRFTEFGAFVDKALVNIADIFTINPTTSATAFNIVNTAYAKKSNHERGRCR